MKEFKEQLPYGLIGFLIILVLDIGNMFTTIINSMGLYEVVTITLIILAIACIYFRIDVSVKLPINSELDVWMIRGTYVLGLYIVFIVVAFIIRVPIFAWYKLLGTCIFMVIDLTVLLGRMRVIEAKQKEIREQKKNQTYTLKDLYDGRLSGYIGEMLLLDEGAVDYDLLHREELVENIIKIVENCYPNKKFVLSLSGKWGSGKTTILNIVKKRLQVSEDILIVDNFDPWNYEDEVALFSGILDTIFKYSGVNYSISKQRKWKKDLLALIFNVHESTRGVKFSFLNEDKATVSVVRDRINEYMSLSKFRLVFILDNIERLGSEKILFLLKTVADVLNLDKVIYILSYDPVVLENLLAQQHYGMEYLKKIVQVEFYVPEFDGEVKNDVFYRCIHNILQLYEIDKDQKRLILKRISLIIEYIQDIRDIKRFLNSIMSILYFVSKGQGKRLVSQLDIGDYILLEFIKRENRELYEIIWNNASYFVSIDKERMFEYEFLYEEILEKRSEEIKKFYQKLFENKKHNKYKILLEELFPYVEHYVAGRENILNYKSGEEGFENTIKNHRIYDWKFFSMYFTQYMNEKVDSQNVVERFIKLCNGMEKEKATKELEKVCGIYKVEKQVNLFEKIQMYTTDLTIQGWETLFDVLYDDILYNDILFYNIIYDYEPIEDNILLLFKPDPRGRVIYILSLALEQVSSQFFNDFLLRMKNEYSRMKEIGLIIEHNRVVENENIKYNGRAAKVHKKLCAMASYVIEHKLDMYDDMYYRERNIWGWYHAIQCNHSINIKKEFHYMLTPKNIYRFLWDMTSESLDGVYGYRLDEDNFEIFCDLEEIEKCISLHIPKTRDEKFVWEIYDAYKNETEEKGRTIFRLEKEKLRL